MAGIVVPRLLSPLKDRQTREEEEKEEEKEEVI